MSARLENYGERLESRDPEEISDSDHRLQSDINELEKLAGKDLVIQRINAACIVVILPEDTTRNVDLVSPRSFMISVSRYYPHSPPEVKCLDDIKLPYLDENKVVVHPAVSKDWSAIKSLVDIVKGLFYARTHPFERSVDSDVCQSSVDTISLTDHCMALDEEDAMEECVSSV